MDPALEEIWSALQLGTSEREGSAKAESKPLAESGPSPESMRHQAYVLSADGLRREAADMLRSAVNLADSMKADPRRQIPLLEALAEVLWQLGEKQEARIRANRAIHLWFESRPSKEFDMAMANADPAALRAM